MRMEEDTARQHGCRGKEIRTRDTPKRLKLIMGQL